MVTVKKHYEDLLGDVYAWSVTGTGDPFARGAQWLSRHGLDHADHYVDLGAGFGAHVIPLARAGKTVTAVDECRPLLLQLQQHLGTSAGRVTVQEDDILSFLNAEDTPTWDMALCAGDTVTHLPSWDAVRELLAAVHRRLVPEGRLALSYRDSTHVTAEGTARFIEVAQAPTRVMHCLLEPIDERSLRVTDILTDVHPSGPSTRFSDYLKVRIAPSQLAAWAAAAGFAVERDEEDRGMVTQVFRRLSVPSPPKAPKTIEPPTAAVDAGAATAGATGTPYQADLAYVHATAFLDLAQAASAEVIPRLQGARATVSHVVDVGCGAGLTTRALVESGFIVTAVEPSAALRDIARVAAPSATFLDGSAYDIEVPGCEAIIAIGEPLTYHEPGTDADAAVRGFIHNARKALCRDGLLIFDVILADGPALDDRAYHAGSDWAILYETRENRAAQRLTRRIETFRRTGDGLYRRAEEVHHVKLFPEGALRAWLDEAGFDVETSQRYSAIPLAPRRMAFFATRR